MTREPEDQDDLRLRGWFRERRESGIGPPPPTYASLTRGTDDREGAGVRPAPRQAASPLRAGALLWRVAGLALVASVLVLTLRRGWRDPGGADDEALRLATALGRWQAPTDFLLATPGIDYLRSAPQLGIDAETLTGERLAPTQTEVSR